MAISEIQLVANRRNALRSTGPVSAEGKLRSAANAIKHGIYSQTSVLFNEDREDYDRLIRARYIEAATLDLQLDETEQLVEERFESIDQPSRLAYALQLLDSAQCATYAGVQRQETRLHRHYERAYRLLQEMQKREPLRKTSRNEPISLAA